MRQPIRVFSFVFVAAGVMALTACSPRAPVGPLGSGTMPDPGGCYVLVYERPQFMGAREFLNGPRKYTDLRDLPFRANWRRRIRSAEVGPGATVTMWMDEGFQGTLQMFRPDTKHPMLPEALSRGVESVDVGCTPPGAAQGQPSVDSAKDSVLGR